jgi:tetratricopeptide (TPR) repeat protein
MSHILEELKRRKVFRTSVAYLAAVFVLLQVADLTFEPLGLPANALTAVIIACVAGFPLAVGLSWFFELRAEKGVRTASRLQLFAFGTFIVITAVVVGFATVRWRAAAGTAGVRTMRSSSATQAPLINIDDRIHNDYLRGRYFLNRTTPASLDSAVVLLEGVVARKPDFANAHAALALAYMYQRSTYRADDRSLEQKSLLASERALTLDPRNPDAHIARGRILWTPAGGFAHEQAAEEYRQAIALQPNNSEAYFQLGQILAHVGLIDEAIANYEQSLRFNSVDPRPRVWRGQAMLYRGAVPEALDVLLSAPEDYNPTMVGYQIAWALSRLGRAEEARAVVTRYMSKHKDDAGALTSIHAFLLAKAGAAEAARAEIRTAATRQQSSIHFHHTAYNIGLTYAVLNQPDSAVAWLRNAADQGLPCYSLFKSDPDLRNLRRHARFVALLSDLQRREAHYRSTLLSPRTATAPM